MFCKSDTLSSLRSKRVKSLSRFESPEESLIMNEKPHVTPAVFVPFTDEDYVGISSSRIGTVEPYHHPGQRLQLNFKRLVYVSIVATALCFAGIIVGRYPMTINDRQIPEAASGNHPPSLSHSSSIDETFALVEEPWDDMLPMTIPVNGVRCECGTDSPCLSIEHQRPSSVFITAFSRSYMGGYWHTGSFVLTRN